VEKFKAVIVQNLSPGLLGDLNLKRSLESLDQKTDKLHTETDYEMVEISKRKGDH